jgi:hypothetical protein
MANFTQLHLSNNPQDPKKQEPKKDDKSKQPKSLSKEKTLFGAGLLAITVMSGVFLLITNGCSKGSKTASSAIEPPVSNSIATSPVSAPTPVVAAVQPPAVTPKPAKKRVQRTAPMTTYSEPNYGLSFRYPKNYILKANDEKQLDLAGLGPVQTNFIQPGAVTVASLELPRASYPGTDFTAGFFSVSVNSAISKDQCEQFAFPKSEHPENEPGNVSRVKIAGAEYSMVEDFGDSAKKEPHLKYFHHFENGSCYEFSMGLGTVDGNIAGLKPVNRSLVFGKLEQILASVKLQPVEVPEVAKDAPAHPIVEGSKE